MSEKESLVIALLKFQRWCETGGPDLVDQLTALTQRAEQAEKELADFDEMLEGMKAGFFERITAAEAEVKRLRVACAKSNDEVCQIAGKALGYMWFKEDQKTFPGATEKTGVFVGEHVAETIVSELAKKFMDVVASEKRLREGIEGLSCCRVVIRDVMNELVDQEASGIRPHTCVDFDEQINGLLRLDRDIALLAQPSDEKEATDE